MHNSVHVSSHMKLYLAKYTLTKRQIKMPSPQNVRHAVPFATAKTSATGRAVRASVKMHGGTGSAFPRRGGPYFPPCGASLRYY